MPSLYKMSLTDIGTRYMHLAELADLWRDGLSIHERFMSVDSPSDGLKKKKLEAITVLHEADWQKQEAESSAAAGAGMRRAQQEGEIHERDERD